MFDQLYILKLDSLKIVPNKPFGLGGNLSITRLSGGCREYLNDISCLCAAISSIKATPCWYFAVLNHAITQAVRISFNLTHSLLRFCKLT